MKTFKQIIILLLVLTMFTTYVFAEKNKNEEKTEETVKIEKTVESVGMAAVVGGDIARAKDIAIQDAQIKALEEVCGAFIDAETIGENYDKVETTICKNTKGYISSYKIISEEIKDFEDSKLVYVKINAEINVNQVYSSLKDIKEIYDKLGKPKFFIFANVKNNKGEDDSDQIESIMAENLHNMGFEIIDPTMLVIKGVSQNANDLFRILKEGHVKMLVWIDSETNANSVKTQTRSKGLLGDIVNNLTVDKAKTKISLKFVDIDNADIYYTKELTADTGGITLFGIGEKEDTVKKSLNKFFKENSEELSAQLFNKWVDLANKTTLIVKIKNIKRADIKNIKKAIEENDRFFKGFGKEDKFRSGEVELEISTKSKIDNFLDMLESININNSIIEIDSVEGELISANLITKE